MSEMVDDAGRNPWMSRGVLLLLAIGCWFLASQVVLQLREAQRLRTDQAELESVEYGMLDAQTWVNSVIWILEKQIRQFDFGPQNRAILLDSFSRMLDTLMVKVDEYIREKNNEGGGWQRFVGRMKQSLQDFLVDFQDLRTQAPEYAEAIMIELNKPEAREDLIAFMTGTLRDLASSTFTEVDRSALQAIMDEHNCTEANFCRALLNAKSKHLEAKASAQTALLLALVVVMIVLIARDLWRPTPNDRSAWPLLFMLAAITALMVSGVVTPMLNVEARISELRMSLLGEEIAFVDQVLYFQSKSVFDIVIVMFQSGDVKSAVVGVLVMTFSVVFPLIKVAAGAGMLSGGEGWRRNRVIQFFALKSSKWSMADVMVVAIIMGYLGFDGLMESQLGKISQVPTAEVLTTNGTELQLGFFLFFGFCIASLLTSTLLERHIGQNQASTPVPA